MVGKRIERKGEQIEVDRFGGEEEEDGEEDEDEDEEMVRMKSKFGGRHITQRMSRNAIPV